MVFLLTTKVIFSTLTSPPYDRPPQPTPNPPSLQPQISQPIRVVPSPNPALVSPLGSGITCGCCSQQHCENNLLYPQDPDFVHPFRRLNITPLNEVLHCTNLYARQPVPCDGAVDHQDQRPHDVLLS